MQMDTDPGYDLLITTDLGRRLVGFAQKHDLLDGGLARQSGYPVEDAVHLATSITSDIFNRKMDAAQDQATVYLSRKHLLLSEPELSAAATRAAIVTQSATWQTKLPFDDLPSCEKADALQREKREFGHFATMDPEDIYRRTNYDSAIARAKVEAALYNQLHEQLGEEFYKQASPVTALRFKGIEFVPHQAADIDSHIARHDAASLTIGSKFSLDRAATGRLLDQGDADLAREFLTSFMATGAVKRVELKRTFDTPVGTDALIDLANTSPKEVFQLVRDAGTRNEAVIKVVLAPATAIPKTQDITLIGGAYGPTVQAGFYAAFPGNPGAAFSDTDYWKTHGFLATREQVVHTLEEMHDNLNRIKPATASPEAVETMIADARKRVDAFAPAPLAAAETTPEATGMERPRKTTPMFAPVR